MVLFETSQSSTCSNAEPLSRAATNANPRQLPMNRSVTPPANGGGVRLAPMDRKRPRRSRAVASALDVQRQSLVWPVTSSARWRLVPRTPRHMPRQSSRSFVCAVSARRLLPLPCKHVSRSRRPFRFAPGRAGPRGCGGAAPGRGVSHSILT